MPEPAREHSEESSENDEISDEEQVQFVLLILFTLVMKNE